MTEKRDRHNKHAPYWAAALALFGLIGISTTVFSLGEFWNGYVLDMTGPAWNYILFRLRFTEYTDHPWAKFFSPVRTLLIFVAVAFGMEATQLLDFYDATFDPWDLVAYLSLLVPLFIIDIKTLNELIPGEY